MADRVGRKPVILLAYGGMALGNCLIPLMLGPWKHTLRGTPNLMLALSLLNFIGGGIPVLMATVFAMAADVSNDENK
jgi:MFS family permease